jgi:hypothetical protein
MTTGRINQVTTFRTAFAATIYSRVTSTRFRDVEFIITFCVLRSTAAQRIGAMAPLDVEPANGIVSFPILARPK